MARWFPIERAIIAFSRRLFDGSSPIRKSRTRRQPSPLSVSITPLCTRLFFRRLSRIASISDLRETTLALFPLLFFSPLGSYLTNA